MSYATPTQFWSLAAPPDTLFEDCGYEPGAIGAVTRTASGLGSLVVSPSSNPRDAWPVVVKCVAPGELNGNYLNPGAPPRFQVSYNAGVDYWWQILDVEQTGDGTAVLKVVKGGFSLLLKNGTSGAPVTIGTGDASLVLTPLRAGASLTILVGSALDVDYTDGAVVLVVTGSTTAAAAAAFLGQHSAVYSYFTTVAGGTGAGAVVAAAKTSLPFTSFALNDTWAFQTAPSPDVLAAQKTAFDHLNSRWRSSFQFPLLSWDSGIEMCESVYARWFLLKRRGLDKRQDMKVYNPALFEEGKEYADGVANGNIHPDVTQSTPGATLFPDTVPQIDPLSSEAGSFGI